MSAPLGAYRSAKNKSRISVVHTVAETEEGGIWSGIVSFPLSTASIATLFKRSRGMSPENHRTGQDISLFRGSKTGYGLPVLWFSRYTPLYNLENQYITENLFQNCRRGYSCRQFQKKKVIHSYHLPVFRLVPAGSTADSVSGAVLSDVSGEVSATSTEDFARDASRYFCIARR